MKTQISIVLLAASLVSATAFAQPFHHGRQVYFQRGYRSHYYAPYYSYRAPYVYRPGVSIVASVPFGAVMLHFGGYPYHYYNGIFYRPQRYGFVITTPPVGIVVPVLPPGSVSVMIGGFPYYYYSGTYYMPLADNRYKVIEPPAASDNNDGAVADNGYEKIVIDGRTYYKHGSTYYKAIIDDSGAVTYEAVGDAGK